eukprot:GHVS01050110.1.p1 GENE.GHVS01050110.1~~GHVS01050110.1.p1  ORF type:complete len:587 (+),score=39.15 GHVS01050110.1:2-1762(+)
MMFRADAYVWVCETGEQIPCTRQQELVGNLLVYGSTGQFVFSIFAGVLLDYTGPKITACLGQSMKAAGWLLLAFASESFRSYLPAFILIGGSCDVSNFPLFTICNIFLEKRVIPLFLLGAASMTSTCIPLVMYATWKYLDQGPEFLVDVCGVYVGVFLGLSMLNAIFLTPWSAVRTTFEEAEGDEKKACKYHIQGATEMNESTSSRSFPSAKHFNTVFSSKKPSTFGADNEDEYRQASSVETQSSNHDVKQPWKFGLPVARPAIDDSTTERDRSSHRSARGAGEFLKDTSVTETAFDTQSSQLQSIELTAAHEQQQSCPGGPNASFDMTEKPMSSSQLHNAKGKGELSPEPSFWTYTLDLSYLIVLPYFCIALLRSTFITISGEEQFGEAYSVWAMMSAMRSIPIFTLGYFGQKLGVTWLLFLLNAMGVFAFLFLLISGKACQYLAMLCSFFFTSASLTSLYSYIAETQPKTHFGKLCGIITLVAGLMQLAAEPLFRWCKRSDGDSFVYANILMLVLGCVNVGLVGGTYVIIRNRMKLRSRVSDEPRWKSVKDTHSIEDREGSEKIEDLSVKSTTFAIPILKDETL